MKRTVSGIILTLLLMGMLTSAVHIQPVKASGTIYIRADGSIDPPTAPIYTADNTTYTLIGDITADAGGIVVERDNIIIDGGGHTLRGLSQYSTGIDLSDRTNVTVKNTQITAFYSSIVLYWSDHNSICGNNISASETGIMGSGAYGVANFNYICGNEITKNFVGIFLNGTSNNISGNSVTENTQGIFLGCCVSGNIISGNNIANNKIGINFTPPPWSPPVMIYHNNFIENGHQMPGFGSDVWDNGYPSGGNYWSDYSGTDMHSGSYQNETGSDGIGDTTYVIDANNIDNYPLMKPWFPYENGTVYIRDDGSVDPSGATILRKGDLYILTSNITSNADGIVIERDNVTLKGAGYTLEGEGNSLGIDLSGKKRVTVEGMNIKAFAIGINMDSALNNNILGNSMAANGYYDIWLNYSSSNVIYGNKVASIGFGIFLVSSSNNTVEGNNVLDSTWGIGLSSFSNYNTIFGNNLTLCNSGIRLVDSYDNLVSGNNASDIYHDICLETSNNNTVSDNNINYFSLNGIYLDSSVNNVVTGNNVSGVIEAIGLGSSSGNLVSDNNATGDIGIVLEKSSEHNTLVSNNIMGSSYGIWLSSSSNNTIYHNNFGAHPRGQQVFLYGSTSNSWDDGCEGNYWSDYNGTDSSGDGIGDTPYPIDANNTDTYPLMNVYWNPCDINHDLIVDMKDVGTAASAFATYPGDARWNPHADITGPSGVPDGCVDMRDIGSIASRFMQSYP